MKKWITERFEDELTGLDFGLDRQGRTHLLEFLTNAAEELPKDSIYLKAFCEKNWSNINDFQKITCTLTGEPNPMLYTIPANKKLNLESIIAATNGRYKGISLVGIFVDDILESFFPVGDQLFYSFNEKINIKGKLEIKFKPFNKRTKLSIFVHGLLI